MLTRRSLLSLSAAAVALPGGAFAASPLNVAATTGMIADTARRIGGDAVSVRALMGAGVDPHAYRQTRSDIVAMTRADMVLWNGLFLEAQMEDFFADLAGRKPVIAVTDRLEAAAREGSEDILIAHADYAGAFDPHVWMDPEIWSRVAARIAEVVTAERPDAGDAIATNLAGFQAELMALRDYGRSALSAIPRERRILLTAHDAFSYFGRAFDMEVLGVQGISTESEAGLHRIRDMVDLLVSRQIDAVFVESSVSDRNMRALIEGAAAQGHEVRLGGQLFSDAMGPEGTYEGTFVGMLDHNLTTIARALGADVPEGGLNGRLAAGS